MITHIITSKFLKQLRNLEFGSLQVVTPDDHQYSFEGPKPGICADIKIHDWRAISNLAVRGDIGFAEAYRSGFWDSSNLESLFTLAMDNEHVLSKYMAGNPLFQTLSRLSYLFTTNTLNGSKKNIHAHYDIGNSFYKLWLDPSMTYSSALFDSNHESLEEAQYNKYDRILSKMENSSGSLLEIGCGWGGFAMRAQKTGHSQYNGITLSEEQFLFAQAQLQNPSSIALKDYRHLKGSYDYIVSIEMFEAVGEKFWPTYFNKLGNLLNRGGKAIMQTITIEDNRFENYRRGGDFIRSYIFPGGMLPSISRFKNEAKKSGMKTGEFFSFGNHYARTIESWLMNFESSIPSVKKLGFDDEFIRLWRFYLAACAAGFRNGRTNVVQVELQHA